jgi:hypothetical protein
LRDARVDFDRVNHDKLMGQIAKRVEDKRLLKLIRAFLNAGVMENGLVSPSVEGTPHGPSRSAGSALRRAGALSRVTRSRSVPVMRHAPSVAAQRPLVAV